MKSSGTYASQRVSFTICYKCCKTKQFIHYVCVKCSNVYPKSCLPRFRSQVNFIKGNKIICCKSENEWSINSDSDEEKINLEKPYVN